MSTYRLHCTAKTGKFFLARNSRQNKCRQKHAAHAESNTDHVAATADHASENNVLPTKSKSMHLHTRAQNRGSHRNQIFTERLGRATIGPSGAELDGGFGVKQERHAPGINGTCKTGCQGRSTLTEPKSPRRNSLRRRKGRNSPFHAFNNLS